MLRNVSHSADDSRDLKS